MMSLRKVSCAVPIAPPQRTSPVAPYRAPIFELAPVSGETRLSVSMLTAGTNGRKSSAVHRSGGGAASALMLAAPTSSGTIRSHFDERLMLPYVRSNGLTKKGNSRRGGAGCFGKLARGETPVRGTLEA